MDEDAKSKMTQISRGTFKSQRLKRDKVDDPSGSRSPPLGLETPRKITETDEVSYNDEKEQDNLKDVADEATQDQEEDEDFTRDNTNDDNDLVSQVLTASK